MVPKPFPYPLGIGIDVCKVPRVASFLRNQSLRNRWARKTFTRLEWPALWDQFQKTRRVTIEDARHVNREDWKMDSRENLSYVQDNGHIDKSIWMLPYIPTRWFTMKGSNQSEAAYNEAVSHERSPIGLLARHLAGRWAAKEAVIKAHSNRRLYLRDVSIVNPRLSPGMFPVELAKKSKAVALIDPPMDTILIDERVAEIRALRGFGMQSQGLQKGALLTRREHDINFSSKTFREEPLKGAMKQSGSTKYLERRAKIKESERQIAEVNISHDGNTAVAVCLALDQPEPERKTGSILDDGRSLPIHEPQWGDEGWFSKDNTTKTMPERNDSTDSEEYKEAMDSFFKQSERKIPFLP